MHGSESGNIHFLENADIVDGGINLTPATRSGTYYSKISYFSSDNI